MPLISSYFSTISEPRYSKFVHFPLQEVLFSVFICLLCGARDYDDIHDYSVEYLGWYRKYLAFKHGIASVSTYQRVMRLLSREALAESFAAFMRDILSDKVLETHLAIDGKALRGSKTRLGKGQKNGALHLVSVYASELGLSLAQQRVEGKSNEITAIPLLLETLALKGAIITIDAMGTQKDIANAIIEGGGDYLLALKGNKGELHDDVMTAFKEETAQPHPSYSATEAGHGRIETRKCSVITDVKWLHERHPDWAHIKAIIALQATRENKKSGEISHETRYFIASFAGIAEKYAKLIRAHWAIEAFHWTLDVTFREDESRIRKDNAPENMAIIRKLAYNILKADDWKKSIKGKSNKAALNQEYREKLINQ